MVVIQGYFKKPYTRQIAGEFRRAREEHSCFKCDLPIFPGEEYFREVKVYYGYDSDHQWRYWMQVRKQHLYCPDEDFEGRMEKPDEESEAGAQIA